MFHQESSASLIISIYPHCVIGGGVQPTIVATPTQHNKRSHLRSSHAMFEKMRLEQDNHTWKQLLASVDIFSDFVLELFWAPSINGI